MLLPELAIQLSRCARVDKPLSWVIGKNKSRFLMKSADLRKYIFRQVIVAQNEV